MSKSILINTIAACIMCLGIGYLFGFIVFGMPKLPQKEYALVAHLCYERAGYYSLPDIKCDSVKGDTIWRDGLQVINKHIVSVEYK